MGQRVTTRGISQGAEGLRVSYTSCWGCVSSFAIAECLGNVYAVVKLDFNWSMKKQMSKKQMSA